MICNLYWFKVCGIEIYYWHFAVLQGLLEWVLDNSKSSNKFVQERIVVLQKEKDQLTLEYRNKRQSVDNLKDSLQKQIQSYSKLAESSKRSKYDSIGFMIVQKI